jgi:hypothetical protein
MDNNEYRPIFDDGTFACIDCTYCDYRDSWCTLWDVQINDITDSHCDSGKLI